MLSTMQDVPLQVRRLFEHGTSVHGGAHVATAVPGGYRHVTYAQVGANTARLAHALRALGVRPGDRVATFMWNNQEHLEAYYAAPCMGAIVHPLDIRLRDEQIALIANHAEDRVVIVDDALLPQFARLVPRLATVTHIVVNGAATFDAGAIPVHRYQDLVAGQPDSYPWPAVDEREAAAMSYTPGPTGDPRGVIYSHRSIYLHALGSSQPDVFDLSTRDRVLVAVPQFDALAWGLPYAAFLTGASLAMPDRFLAACPLADFIADARPTKGAAVPAVWQALLHHVDASSDTDISSLKEAVVGGSACPPALMAAFETRYRVALLHAWGMTEMSPLGTLARPPAGAEPAAALRYRHSQGRFVASVEARLVG